MLYHLFDDPEWFKQMGKKGYPLYLTAMVIVWTVNLLIILSTFAFCLESLPAFCTQKDTGRCTNDDPEFYATVWMAIEAGCVFVFTIDFLTRLICCIIMGKVDFERFRGDPMNYVDVIAVFPFYIQLLWGLIFPATCVATAASPREADIAACTAVTQLDDDFACRSVMGSVLTSASVCTYTKARQVMDTRFVRVIRLARVLQSLPEKYAGMGGIVVDILRTAAMPLILPIYLMFLGCIVFASMAYYVEMPVTENCYFDGDTGNSVLCESGDVPGTNCNMISGWTSVPGVAGNDGCLTEGGCGCGCDAAAHVYRRAQLYYDSCRLTGSTHQDLETLYAVGDAPSCASWKSRPESETIDYLPNVTGVCTGVITYETWDRAYHPAEYTSDMFADGAPGGIFTAMWWCVVTFTTVGYGDMNPRTPQGQIVAVLTMLTGIFFLAMPLAVVGGSFHSSWAKAEAEHEVFETQKALAQAKREGKPAPPSIPSSRELVDANYGDKSERGLQDVKSYITAMLAKSEQLRELAGGLDYDDELATKLENFQRDLKLVSQKLGDQSTIVTESFLGENYAARDIDGELLESTRGHWWGNIAEHVHYRSDLVDSDVN